MIMLHHLMLQYYLTSNSSKTNIFVSCLLNRTAKNIEYRFRVQRGKSFPVQAIQNATPVSSPHRVAYLLCDCAGTLNELPLGEAVGGADLQGSSLLHQVDAAMAQLLHPCLDLKAHLKSQTKRATTASHSPVSLRPFTRQWQSCPGLTASYQSVRIKTDFQLPQRRTGGTTPLIS